MQVSDLGRLADRQITDILVQAERILSGDADETAIDEFARYTLELIAFLVEHTKEKMILERLRQIPVISYRPVHMPPLMILVLPYSIYSWWYNYTLKMEVLRKVRTIKDIFSSIQFLNKSIRN